MAAARQQQKGEAFRALHEGEPFVVSRDPWDAGSARVLEALGFRMRLRRRALGFAFTLGRLDGGATLDDVAEHVAALDRATELPVSVDLENGYGAEADSAALAITRVAESGAVGGSIEDFDPAASSTSSRHATERVAAAVEAARALDFPFTLTARAENHIRGNPDLDGHDRSAPGVRGGRCRRPLRAGSRQRGGDSTLSATRSRSRSTSSPCRASRSREMTGAGRSASAWAAR